MTTTMPVQTPAAVTALAWSDTLQLNHGQLDQTHHEMVDLINALATVLSRPEQDPLPTFQCLLEHTEAHFALEEGWMAATGFEPDNCHSSQHKMVLNVLHEVRRHATELKDLEPMRIVVGELAQWLPAHAEMMDTALVYHLGQMGFDPATGRCNQPLPAAAGTSGCGSSSCG